MSGYLGTYRIASLDFQKLNKELTIYASGTPATFQRSSNMITASLFNSLRDGQTVNLTKSKEFSLTIGCGDRVTLCIGKSIEPAGYSRSATLSLVDRSKPSPSNVPSSQGAFLRSYGFEISVFNGGVCGIEFWNNRKYNHGWLRTIEAMQQEAALPSSSTTCSTASSSTASSSPTTPRTASSEISSSSSSSKTSLMASSSSYETPSTTSSSSSKSLCVRYDLMVEGTYLVDVERRKKDGKYSEVNVRLSPRNAPAVTAKVPLPLIKNKDVFVKVDLEVGGVFLKATSNDKWHRSPTNSPGLTQLVSDIAAYKEISIQLKQPLTKDLQDRRLRAMGSQGLECNKSYGFQSQWKKGMMLMDGR
ncbi:unnamed protein product [Sympodiomycopsis kandeliae]